MMLIYPNRRVEDCQICHGDLFPDHCIEESFLTKQKAKQIVDILEDMINKRKGGIVQRKTRQKLRNIYISQLEYPSISYNQGFTLGVISTDQGYFSAVSGYLSDVPISFQTASLAAHVNPIRLLEPNPTLTTRGGREIPKEMLTQVTNRIMRCAAQKLVYFANHEGISIYNMSEVWFDYYGGLNHGRSIESCATCRVVLPLMLCRH